MKIIQFTIAVSGLKMFLKMLLDPHREIKILSWLEILILKVSIYLFIYLLNNYCLTIINLKILIQPLIKLSQTTWETKPKTFKNIFLWSIHLLPTATMRVQPNKIFENYPLWVHEYTETPRALASSRPHHKNTFTDYLS